MCSGRTRRVDPAKINDHSAEPLPRTYRPYAATSGSHAEVALSRDSGATSSQVSWRVTHTSTPTVPPGTYISGGKALIVIGNDPIEKKKLIRKQFARGRRSDTVQDCEAATRSVDGRSSLFRCASNLSNPRAPLCFSSVAVASRLALPGAAASPYT